MKVLQVLPSLQNGGAEKFVCELANELVNEFNISCDISIMYDTDSSVGFKNHLKNVNCICLHKKKGFDIGYLFRLYRLIKKNKYTVVHAHLTAITYLILSAILLRNVKFIATIHSDAYFEASHKVDKFIRRVLFRTKRVTPITISEKSNKSFKECYSVDARIIYNGISPYDSSDSSESDGQSKSSSGDLIFIHPASCQPVKNQKMLLSVFQKITQKYSNVYLYWFGSTFHHSELFSQLSVYFSDNVKYCGCVNDIRSYLCKAHAICLSSIIEGMPMVIIEAFSVGCIPLVTPVGGCLDMIVTGKNGFISPSLDENDYYEMIEHFITLQGHERRNISEQCLDSFKNYSIRKSAESYISAYLS